MSAPEKQPGASDERLRYLRVIREGTEGVEERVPGYRTALGEHLAEILALERGHVHNRTNIIKRIEQQVDALGRFLVDSDWQPARSDES